MRKPNYNMERKDRERAKEAKATAKVENLALKRDESGQLAVSTTDGLVHSDEIERQKPGD